MMQIDKRYGVTFDNSPLDGIGVGTDIGGNEIKSEKWIPDGFGGAF